MSRNIALLVIDATRSDIFEERAEGLLSRGDLIVDHCCAPSSWTPPSHASMLTGDLPSVHGVNAHNIDFTQIKGGTVLNELPHRTIGVSANGFLSPDFGFDTLFDNFLHFYGNEEFIPGGVDITKFAGDNPTTFIREAVDQGEFVTSMLNATYIKMNNTLQGTPFPRLGDYGAAKLISSAKRMTKSPFFLFMNFVDVHGPHENICGYGSTGVPNAWTSQEKSVWDMNFSPDTEYLENYYDLYKHAVSYVDGKVAKFVDWLVSEFDTTVIVTADHGEGLGAIQNEVFGHKGVSPSVLEVPFLVINPPEALSRDRFSLLDLPDLIRWINGQNPPPTNRENLPAERLGDPDAPAPEWDMVERAVSTPSGWYKWDAESGSTVPERVRHIFPNPIREITDSTSKLQVDGSVEEHLKDLGYK